jgi:hypothetical protein
MKTVYSPNKSQHKSCCVDLLSPSFWNFFRSGVLLRGVLILEGEPPPLTRYNIAEYDHIHSPQRGQQLLAVLSFWSLEILRQLVGHPSQME